jgi:hypothetical protein
MIIAYDLILFLIKALTFIPMSKFVKFFISLMANASVLMQIPYLILLENSKLEANTELAF